MLKILKALQEENVVNIKQLQKSPSRYLKGVTRIMRGSKTHGFFFDPRALEDFLEDWEAANSENFKKSIARARARKDYVSHEEMMKKYGL